MPSTLSIQGAGRELIMNGVTDFTNIACLYVLSAIPGLEYHFPLWMYEEDLHSMDLILIKQPFPNQTSSSRGAAQKFKKETFDFAVLVIYHQIFFMYTFFLFLFCENILDYLSLFNLPLTWEWGKHGATGTLQRYSFIYA